MAISDARFGGEVVMKTGKIHTFDAVECLVAWAAAADASTMAGVYVVDLQHPGTLVPAEAAGFLKGAMVPSPMGRAISAFATPAIAEQQRAVLSGSLATWKELLAEHAAPPGGRS
jgi:copper chaperone NosL